jgi:hypothetical protein
MVSLHVEARTLLTTVAGRSSTVFEGRDRKHGDQISFVNRFRRHRRGRRRESL